MKILETYDNLSSENIEKVINDYKNYKQKRNRSYRSYNSNNFQMNYMMSPMATSRFMTANPNVNEINTSRYLLFYFYKERDAESNTFIRLYGGKLNNLLDSIHLFTVYDKSALDEWGDIKGKDIILNEYNNYETTDSSSRFDRLKQIGDSFDVNEGDYPCLLVYDLETKVKGLRIFKGNDYKGIYDGIKKIVISINEDYHNFDLSQFTICTPNYKISKMPKDFLGLYEQYTSNNRGSITKLAEIYKVNDRTYNRRINSKHLYKKFNRDDIILMSFVFGLDLTRTNELLLSYDRRKELDPNDGRDHIIIESIENKRTIERINLDLSENGYEKLNPSINRIEYED